MVNVPKEELTRSTPIEEIENKEKELRWKKEIENEIFVYAGFI